MLALAHHYDEPVSSGGVTYRARVYSGRTDDDRWGAWIVFFPVGGGRVIATDRETTQSTLPDLQYWASGLTHTYLQGALERAISLQPEEQIARELLRLERLETSAELQAENLEMAAETVRIESNALEAARQRTEDRLLETVADQAEIEAVAHEAAAGAARQTAKAAESARWTGSRRTSSKKK